MINGPPPISGGFAPKWLYMVYSLLWESAYMDTRIDKRRNISKNDRRDCGGTSGGQ